MAKQSSGVPRVTTKVGIGIGSSVPSWRDDMNRMNLQPVRAKVKSGEIDTVIVAFPDVFGRLMGKRFTGKCFVDSIAEHGTHACNYLMTVDLEMEPMIGFKLANWEKGFG